MKILSLFDGISVAQQAFKELGFEVEYYASEIDKYANKYGTY
jgi:site-specific DNA-cytosine methylase